MQPASAKALQIIAKSLGGAVIVAIGLALGACTTTSQVATSQALPEQLPPVAGSTVQTASLPPIGPDGQIMPATPTDATGNQMLVQPAAQTDGGFVSLDAVGSVPGGSGRNLSAGLTVEKLLGGWTVIAGTQQCRLNLTQTTKVGTQRYRASTPGCQIPGLNVVASWQLAGPQVQLFDENGDRVGVMQLSGERFIGTLAGVLGVSMIG